MRLQTLDFRVDDPGLWELFGLNECTLHPRKDMNFRGRQSVVDQNVSLQESCIEALTLDVMIFGDGALGR